MFGTTTCVWVRCFSEIMSFTISTSLIVFCLLLSCTVADLLKSRKLRTLLSSTSNLYEFLPSDGNFQYRISYQDYNNAAEYAIYGPPGQTHGQQWFGGTNLLNEIKISTRSTFAINVDNYCLYHSYKNKRFLWFDCTYNPSQTLEERVATHYYRHYEFSEFRIFFSFQTLQSSNDRIYEKITLSIKTTATTNNPESVTQIPIYCVRKNTDMKIDDTTPLLDMFPWEVESLREDEYWKYQIIFDKPMAQQLGDNNALNSDHLVMPLTVLIQYLLPYVCIVCNILLLMYVLITIVLIETF